MSKGLDYNVEKNQIRRDHLDEKLVSNFEAIVKTLDKIQAILNDIDKRIQELE